MTSLKLPSDTLDGLEFERLGITVSTVELAKEIAEELDYHQITSGRRPETFGACALYVACKLNGEERAARAVGRVVGVTDSYTKYVDDVKEIARNLRGETA